MLSQNIPDISGLTLKDAFKILKKANITSYNIKVTSSPRNKHNRNKHYIGGFRILRVTNENDGIIEILVCDPCSSEV